MCDLNYSIEYVEPERIARYLGMKLEDVLEAIKNGAKTYQDVYNHKK